MIAYRTVWRKLGRHNGVLVAQRVPYEKSERVSHRERDLYRARTARIEHTPDWDAIQRMCRRDSCGLGGKIADIIGRQHSLIRIEGILVAAVKLNLYCYYDHRDLGWTKADMIRHHGQEQVSDCFCITLYRNPHRPRYLKASIGFFQESNHYDE